MVDEQTEEVTTKVNIKQLNLTYDFDQDRLLFKIGLSNQSELQVWITYRMAREMWVALNAESQMPTSDSIPKDATPQEAVDLFEQEAEAVETLSKIDFTTEYDASAYQANEPVVKRPTNAEVVRKPEGVMLAVDMVVMKSGNNPTMRLVCDTNFNLDLNLNPELSLAICTMLQMASKEAGWAIGDGSQEANASIVMEEDSKVLH